MPLVNYSLPNLLQGVSQQPDPLKYDGQCADMLNMFPSIAGGLRRRPNTDWEFALEESGVNIGNIPEDAAIHFVKTRKDEPYVLIHTGTVLYAYNLSTGVLADIQVAGSGTGSLAISAGDYLEVDSDLYTPQEAIRFLTVGDKTFISNRTATPAINQDYTDALDKIALVWVKQGDYSKQYNVTVDGVLGGSATAGTTATCTITWDYYTGFKNSSHWYVASVAVNNAGSGYQDGEVDYTFTLDQNSVGSPYDYQINTEPRFRFNVSAGQISSIDVLEKGNITSAYLKVKRGDEPEAQPITIARPTYYTGGAKVGEFTFGTTSGASTTEANSDSAVIAQQMKTDGTTGFTTKISSGMTCDIYGNLLVLTKTAVSGSIDDFNIRVDDGLGGRGLGVAYREVDDITDLPLFAPNGFRIKVAGDVEESADDYYVEFVTNDGSDVGVGTWREIAGFNIRKGIDASTMPHVLTLLGEDLFEFGEMPLSDRLAGDDDSNPFPSFVGQPINQMFFFKDRLGFVSLNNVSMTEAGLGPFDEGVLKYNFFRATTTSLLDSAPIDVQVTSTKVVDLQHAVTTQDRLMLFADGQQFILRGADILSPATVEVAPVTNFSIDPNAKPLEVGSNIYIPFDRGDFAGVREMDIDIDAEIYRGEEITKHVPQYLPSQIRASAGSTSENVMLFSSPSEPDKVFCNAFLWENNQKVLNSWGKFQMPINVRGMDFIDSKCWMVGLLETRDDTAGAATLDYTSINSTDPLNWTIRINFANPHGLSVGDKFMVRNLDASFGVSTVGGVAFYQRRLRQDPVRQGVMVEVYSVVDTDTVTILVTEEDLESGTYDDDFDAFLVDYSACVISMGFESGRTEVYGFMPSQDLRYAQTAEDGYITTTVPYPIPWWATPSVVSTFSGYDYHSLIESWSGDTITYTQYFTAWSSITTGLEFTSSYTFSEQLFKAPQGQSSTVFNLTKSRIRRCILTVDTTGDIYVTITPRYRTAEEFTLVVSENDGYKLYGSVYLTAGRIPFPIHSRGEDTTIKLTAYTSEPMSLISAEFEVLVESTSERYGR